MASKSAFERDLIKEENINYFYILYVFYLSHHFNDRKLVSQNRPEPSRSAKNAGFIGKSQICIISVVPANPSCPPFFSKPANQFPAGTKFHVLITYSINL